MKNSIDVKFIEITKQELINFVNSCVSCKRETPIVIYQPITLIIPSYVYIRLIVFTSDLSRYGQENDVIKNV